MKSLTEQYEREISEEIEVGTLEAPEKVEIEEPVKPYSGFASDDEILEFNKDVADFLKLIRKYTPISFSVKRILNPPENTVIIQYTPKLVKGGQTTSYAAQENVLFLLGELCGFEENDEKLFALEANDLAFRQIKKTDIEKITAQDVWDCLAPVLGN